MSKKKSGKKSKKTTWADVSKGDTVELRGREWRIVKIKPKGKKATVMVEGAGGYHESKVRLDERVTIVPLLDREGVPQRWATKREHDEALEAMPRGNPEVTKPPKKAAGDPWERPVDRIEKSLKEILGARLVAEQRGPEGHYVPPVSVDTVASHLVIFHGGLPDGMDDEGAMLKMHEAQHAESAKTGAPLAVNHWHTEKRP